jgi:hypothetical protein
MGTIRPVFVSLFAATCFASMAMAAPASADSAAQADYNRAWGTRERQAVTPAQRVKLANDLMAAVDKAVHAKPARKKEGKSGDEGSEVASLAGKKRDEVLLLCTKAYEIGTKQREGYPPAARALGVLQELDPAKRLDSLLKLEKMYEDVYQIAPAKNLGIAKGYAEVNLQVGQEQWLELQDTESSSKMSPVDQAAAIKGVSDHYVRGLSVIRDTISAISPYAKGNKTYESFLDSCEGVEKDLLDSQKIIAGQLAISAETTRNLKNLAFLQGRLKTSAADTPAADRIVRLYLNELDDPAAIETVIKRCSQAVRDVIALMKKPVRTLTAQQAFMVAQWCDKSNDNPESPNKVAMDIRAKVYCEAFEHAAGTKGDADWKQIDLVLHRISNDLTKSKVDAETVKGLCDSYIEALQPAAPAVTAAVPPPSPSPDATDVTAAKTGAPAAAGTDAAAPDKPEVAPVTAQTPAAPVEPEHALPSVKVESPKPGPAPTESSDSKSGSDIFDFGRDFAK